MTAFGALAVSNVLMIYFQLCGPAEKADSPALVLIELHNTFGQLTSALPTRSGGSCVKQAVFLDVLTFSRSPPKWV